MRIRSLEAKMKTFYGIAAIVCGVVAVIFTIVLVIASYKVNREIVGWQARAQVSSEPHDMHDYMLNVKAGMDKWGMTNGYAALIFKTPENDMSLIYRTVQQHIDQAEVLTGMNRATPEYQTGLDNLRGSIRELDLHAFYFWSVHQGLVPWILCFAGFFLCIVFWMLWFSAW